MQSLDELISLVDVETVEPGVYLGRQPGEQRNRVFGGQVVAQAIAAAYRTADGRRLHSLHSYFIRSGDPVEPILFRVERLRDGKSFSVRQLRAEQKGEVIFSMTCSFHVGESGEEHQFTFPTVPPPEELLDGQEIFKELGPTIPPIMARLLQTDRPIEFRFADLEGMKTRRMNGELRNIWIRAKDKLPDDRTLHEIILGYASDLALLDVAAHKHGHGLFDGTYQSSSLDHAMWFHRPFRMDDWLLYSQDSPSMASSRAMTRGSIFTRDGTLVVSVSQEGLLRRSRS